MDGEIIKELTTLAQKSAHPGSLYVPEIWMQTLCCISNPFFHPLFPSFCFSLTPSSPTTSTELLWCVIPDVQCHPLLDAGYAFIGWSIPWEEGTVKPNRTEGFKRHRSSHFSYPVIFLMLLVMGAIANQLLWTSNFLLQALLGISLNFIMSQLVSTFLFLWLVLQIRERSSGNLLSAVLSKLSYPISPMPCRIKFFCRRNRFWQK